MRPPNSSLELVRSGLHGLTPNTATWLAAVVLDEASRCNQLNVAPMQMQVFGEQVFYMRGRECCMSLDAIEIVSTAAFLERLALRVKQLRVELSACVALKGVTR